MRYMDHDIFAAIFVNLDTDRATRAAVKEHFSNDSTIEATLNRLARIADRDLITMQEVTVSIQGDGHAEVWDRASRRHRLPGEYHGRSGC